MGLRRRLVKGLLRKYVHNLQDRHIHVDVGRGCIQIDDAVLEIAPLAQLLEGVLPAGFEIVQARATGIRLDVPWKQIRQRSTVLSVERVTVTVVQHLAATCGRTASPCGYWGAASGRRRASTFEMYAAAKGGPEEGSMLHAITSGLQMSIDSLDVSVQTCDADRPPEQRLAANVIDVFWGPVDPRLQRMTTYSAHLARATRTKELRIGAVSVSVKGEDSLEPFLRPVPLTVRMWSTMPSDGRALCPFSTSTRTELDLQVVCLDGTEDQVCTVLEAVAAMLTAEDLLRQQQGAWLWSSAQYEASAAPCRSHSSEQAAQSPAAVVSDGSVSMRGRSPLPPVPPMSSNNGQKPKRSSSLAGSKRMMQRFLGGRRPSKGSVVDDSSSHISDMTSECGSSAAFPRKDEDAEDSDGIADGASAADSLDQVEDDKLCFFEAGEVDDLPVPEISRNLSFKSLSPTAGPTFRAEPGHVRQSTLTVEVGTLSAGVKLSGSEGRLSAELGGLGYRRVNCAWLLEAEQICAARFNGSLSSLAAVDAHERGAKSLDGVVFSEHQVSVRKCHLKAPASATEQESASHPDSDQASETCTLLDTLDAKEEIFLAVWRSASGEPCDVGADGDDGAVWPLEVVIRSVQVLYVPKMWRRILQVVQPFLSVTSNTPADGQSELALANPRTGRRAKAILLRSIDVVQLTADAKAELPHRAKIHSAELKNVALDLSDLQPFFGLAQSETGPRGIAAFMPDVEEMEEEALRAEVRMWRLRDGR